VKVITLHQPWATVMQLGLKRIETRSWSTPHRGLLAIHAGKTTDDLMLRYFRSKGHKVAVPTGVVLGVVQLVNCVRMTPDFIAQQGEDEREWGDWKHGRYAWVTMPVVWFREPIPATGNRGLWDWLAPPDWRDR